MKKIRLLLTFIAVSIGALQGTWARVAPTFPTAQLLESGKTYYLYNVGSDRFLTNNDGTYYYNVYARTDKGTPVKISAVNGVQYNIQFINNSQYLYQYSGSRTEQSSTTDPSSEEYRFTFTATEGGYLIQRVYNSVETEFWGYNGNSYNDLYSNLTEGNTVWQLLDADEAARFVAKRNLYRALESAEGYRIDQWEQVYNNEASSNAALQSAADELNSGLKLTAISPIAGWSDYKLLFYNENLSEEWSIYDGYYLRSAPISNGSRILKAGIEVDDDATLVFYYGKYEYDYGGVGFLEVYLDGNLQFTINDDEGDTYQPYFVELASGKHTITWKLNSSTKERSSIMISSIGVEHTPTIAVSLKEPGSLGSEILAKTDHVKNVRKLIISGEMNADDWAQILNMNSIFSLDLTDAAITEIPEKALSRGSHRDELSFLHSVKLPKTLKAIGKEAFYGTYLDEITFPEGLETIGYYAFNGTRIREAILPASLVKLDTYYTGYGDGGNFAYCYSLERVSLPASIVSIPEGAFYECKVLQPFQIPEGITAIGRNAFYGCTQFDSAIPSSVASIGEQAFRRSGLTNVVINENATVGDYAFNGCGKLVSAVLPTTYYDDVRNMLAYCGSLSDVTFKSPTMVRANSDMFSGNNLANITLHVPNYLVNTYKQDSYWYNCNVVGFSTENIKKWNIRQPLVLRNDERLEGNPDITVQWSSASINIKGDNAQTFNDIFVDWCSQIIAEGDNVKINGEYTHCYQSDKNYWYFVSLPFDFKVGDIKTENGSQYAIRYYDGANRAENGSGGNWKNYKADDIVKAGTGFIYQTSKTDYSFFYAQENASKQNIVSNKEFVKALAAYPSEATANKGWNLVGNPWQSYYNIHKLNFTAPITVWNVSSRNYEAYSIIDDDYAIRPNQAFFVQCPDEINSISFPIDGRQLTSVIESQNGARSYEASTRKLVDVELTGGELTDKTRLVLNPQATVDYETTCDASKFFSMDANVPQIYSVEGGVQYAINERPAAGGIIQLGILLPANGTYTIKAVRNELTNVKLYDKQTAQLTDLAAGSYMFNGEAGLTENRFELRLTDADVTGIAEMEKSVDGENGKFFNLKGQRVASPKKGVYVINGKKLMMK